VEDESLWPQALQYAVYLHNIMPTEETRVSPVEVWTRTKSNHSDLSHAHTWGSLAYVLSPRLREGGHVSKWELRSKRGKFAGYSPLQASNVGMIRNLNRGYVSPQFHVMYNNFFETMHSDKGSLPSAKVWEQLYIFNHSQVDWDIEPPDLAVEWLMPGERRSCQEQNMNGYIEEMEPLGPPLQREEGQAPATIQPT